MPTFAETAVAEYEAARAAEEAAKAAAEAQAKAALVAAARAKVVPALTAHDGKVLLDPKTLVVTDVSTAHGWVVLCPPDKTVHLLVKGDEVRVTQLDDRGWSDGPVVTSLADVGAAVG